MGRGSFFRALDCSSDCVDGAVWITWTEVGEKID